MNTTSIISALERTFLRRGERGAALIGIGVAVVLLASILSAGWLADERMRGALAAQNLSHLNQTGPLLAELSQRLITDGDLSDLRQETIAYGAGLQVADCTVSIGQGRVVADSKPSRINTLTLPRQWTGRATDADSTASEPDCLRFHFAIPGRGTGLVELRPLPVEFHESAAPAFICVAGLCALLLFYRRTRRPLMEMELLRSALRAIDAGETATEALQLDGRLGTTAAAWNKVLEEINDLRQKLKSAAVVAAPGNRRAGGSNLEGACDAMPQGIILVDDKMRVRYANGAACAFLKRQRNDLAGLPAAELVQNERIIESLSAIGAGKLRRHVTVELEQQGETGSGVLRFCIRPVRRNDNDSAMVIIEDITQQRTAERARNAFINKVTHELRTPLTNIRLHAETAIDDGQENNELRSKCLNVINQESRRLERIVSDMLSVAEIEAGATSIHHSEVYPDALITELQTEYRAMAQEKQIDLQFVVSPKLPKIMADKDKLALAIHNLVGNALKYTPAGGKVTVTVDMRDGQLVIDVADTGFGIDPAETDKIFDRFYRSADPRIGKIVGTGLGLTLAREVMRLHGGDVTVQSEINRGSTFTARLPGGLAA